jgi:hypothetical protein
MQMERINVYKLIDGERELPLWQCVQWNSTKLLQDYRSQVCCIILDNKRRYEMDTNLSGLETVRYSQSSNSFELYPQQTNNTVGLTVGMTWPTYTEYYPYHEHYYPAYYPCYSFAPEKSKIEQAFKIVGKLMEKNLIKKDLNVKDFIKLVNDISEII